MTSVVEIHTEKSVAKISALKHEKASLVSEITANPSDSNRRLEAMIRYTFVVSEIRKIARGIDRLPRDF